MNENARSGCSGPCSCDDVWCYAQCLARASGPVKAKWVYTNVNFTFVRLTGQGETDNPAAVVVNRVSILETDPTQFPRSPPLTSLGRIGRFRDRRPCSCICSCMLIRMQTTSVRIDKVTHQELSRIASELGTTMGETVALVVRHFRQDRIGAELAAPMTPDEVAWLNADLG